MRRHHGGRRRRSCAACHAAAFGGLGQGFGTFGTIGSDGNAARLHQQRVGLLLGIDTVAASTWRIGVAGGYTHSSLDIADRVSDASTDSMFAGAYAGTTFGATQVRLGATYSSANLRVKLMPSFSTLSDTASSGYGGNLGQAFGEAGFSATAMRMAT